LKRVEAKIREIEAFNRGKSGVTLLAGAEVDILPDGSLDYPDALLERLALVIGAIHTWKRDEDVTPRFLAAMDNPFLHAIAHPTGRLIGTREGYRVELDTVIRAAKRTRTALEINGYHERLDLSDANARRAKEVGVKLLLGTDAHGSGQMGQMELCISVARRGWLEKKDVLNTRSLSSLLTYLSKR
jgi:DNA polymerase (family 10)